MKKQEQVKLNAKGWIRYELISPSGSTVTTIPNLVVTNAKAIMAKAIMNQSFIDQIELKDGGGTLATSPVTYNLASPTVAEFKAEFDEASFNTFFEEAHLQSSADGDFSEVTGLFIYKDNTMRLIITWSIEIL